MLVTPSFFRRVAAGTYPIAFMLVAVPLVGLYFDLPSIDPSDPTWRFTLLSAMSLQLPVIVAGLLLFFTANVCTDRREALRSMGFVLGFIVVALAVCAAFSVVDGLVVVRLTKAPRAPVGNKTVIRAVAIYVFAVIAVTWLTIQSFAAAHDLALAKRNRARHEPAPLIIGKPESGSERT